MTRVVSTKPIVYQNISPGSIPHSPVFGPMLIWLYNERWQIYLDTLSTQLMMRSFSQSRDFQPLENKRSLKILDLFDYSWNG